MLPKKESYKVVSPQPKPETIIKRREVAVRKLLRVKDTHSLNFLKGRINFKGPVEDLKNICDENNIKYLK